MILRIDTFACSVVTFWQRVVPKCLFCSSPTVRCPSWCSGKCLKRYTDTTNCKTESPKNSIRWLLPLKTNHKCVTKRLQHCLKTTVQGLPELSRYRVPLLSVSKEIILRQTWFGGDDKIDPAQRERFMIIPGVKILE